MLVFLKLGGSLITDKLTPHTPRVDVLERVAEEIQLALLQSPDLQLILGHGSGSYGHMAAKKYHTRDGVTTSSDWKGFAEVWYEARALNQIVIEALTTAGIPVIAFPISAMAVSSSGKIKNWNLEPVHHALSHHLVPVFAGDVTFDQMNGGTILSTEDIFYHLSLSISPNRIFLAGLEAGVWADYPQQNNLYERITPSTYEKGRSNVEGSSATDVTGGMAQKVELMLDLVQKVPGLEAQIFSGEVPGEVFNVLSGKKSGTMICTD